MKKKFCKIKIFSLAASLVIAFSSVNVFADKTNQYDYNYGTTFIENSVAGFELARVIDKSYFPDIGLETVNDICVGFNKIYIVDTTNSRVNVLDAETYKLVSSIKLIRDDNNKIIVNKETNEQLMLKNPEGIFVSEVFNEIYIADTGAERVLVLNAETNALKRIVTRPDNMVGVTNFKPSKISVDRSGRFYIVVQGSFEGILELNPDGQFSRYFGVNKPKVNPLDYFWKNLSSKEQKEKMAKTFAPSFSNLDIDDEGFVYAVTYDTSSQDMIFRFNAKGENVVRSEAMIPLVGDITRFYVNSSKESAFVDVAVNNYGIYAVVDKSYGRVFVYDFDGYGITIFSKLGFMKGDLHDPSAIEWNGYDLLVGDKELGVIYQYVPTDFGLSAMQASESYIKGDWEKANEMYRETIKKNANYYSAYSGIARNNLMEQKYEEAMYNFKFAKDKTGYSKAYYGYRADKIRDNFIWIALVFVVLVGGVIYTEIRYLKKNKHD